MDAIESIRHVPWTCRWGSFGGPVDPHPGAAPGFLFWVCEHPTQPAPPRWRPRSGGVRRCPSGSGLPGGLGASAGAGPS